MNQKLRFNKQLSNPDKQIRGNGLYLTNRSSRISRFYIKSISLLLFLPLLFIGKSQAQWLTFGDGHDGSAYLSGPNFTDDNRAEVTTYTNSPTWTGSQWQNSLTINCGTSYGSFTVNDRILIVDMDASCSARNYDLATVTGVSGSTITADAGVTNSNVVHVSTGSKSHTQVIKVFQWYYLGLASGAVLTCHAWDGTTGGILALNCQYMLDLTNGTIDAVGKGAVGISSLPGGTPGNNGLVSTWGGLAGGTTGATGTSATYSALGRVSNGNSDIGMGVACGGVASSVGGGGGGCGDHATDGLGPYPGQRTYGFCPSNISKFYFNIGNAGYSGTSGQGAGAGGNGGGGGGGAYGPGLSAPFATDGGQGQNPSGVSTGGTGGDGGTGGGSIYIKTYYLQGPGGSSPVIISNGIAGLNGEDRYLMNFGRGGDGGNGGNGGDAGCSGGGSFYGAGGGGGWGEAGNGPDGGSGGNGGDGGAIWLSYGNTPSSFTSSNIDANGGAGGAGGHGGPPGINGTQGPDGATSTAVHCGDVCGACVQTSWLSSLTYGNPNGCLNIMDVCNCDSAFLVLATMQNHTVSGSDVTYNNPNAGNAANYCIKNSTGLWAYVYTVVSAGNCSTPGVMSLRIYHCPMENCNLHFWTGIANPTGNVSGGLITWKKKGHYYHNVLYDINGDSCVADSCPRADGGQAPTRPRWGFNGAPGIPGKTGDVSYPSAPDPVNDYSGDPARPVIVSGINNNVNNVDIKKLQIKPNPASDYVDISFTSEIAGKSQIKIIDMLGKEIYKGDLSTINGLNSKHLEIKNIAAGSYLICVELNGAKQFLRFVKE